MSSASMQQYRSDFGQRQDGRSHDAANHAGDRVRHPGDDDAPGRQETAEAPGPPRHLARERLR